jgi:hypothetical protein
MRRIYYEINLVLAAGNHVGHIWAEFNFREREENGTETGNSDVGSGVLLVCRGDLSAAGRCRKGPIRVLRRCGEGSDLRTGLHRKDGTCGSDPGDLRPKEDPCSKICWRSFLRRTIRRRSINKGRMSAPNTVPRSSTIPMNRRRSPSR